jgi:hypothetical protein
MARCAEIAAGVESIAVRLRDRLGEEGRVRGRPTDRIVAYEPLELAALQQLPLPSSDRWGE